MKAPTLETVLEEFRGRPVSDLEAAYRRKVENVQDIQAQLAFRKNESLAGRLDRDEFFDWRSSATYALTRLLAEQRVLKEALVTTRRRYSPDTPLKPASEIVSADALLHAAFVTLKKLSWDIGYEELDDAEKDVIKRIEFYLGKHASVGAQ